jgi:catalase
VEDRCHTDEADGVDYFDQPGRLFRLMTPTQQHALFDDTARAMSDAPDFIKQRHVDHCTKADRRTAAAWRRR